MPSLRSRQGRILCRIVFSARKLPLSEFQTCPDGPSGAPDFFYIKKGTGPIDQFLKNKGRTVSRILFWLVIYLRNLPPGSWRATLDCRYIWSCRSRCRTPTVSPQTVVSSCLAFSPLLRPGRSRGRTRYLRAAVIFCYGSHKVTSISAFHCGMLYPVRTFLSFRRDKPSCLCLQNSFRLRLCIQPCAHGGHFSC